MGLKNHNYFVKFVYFLGASLVTIFISSIGGLINVNNQDNMDDLDFIYEFLPKFVTNQKIVYVILSWFMILFTAFFSPFVILLIYVQTKNFMSNRTTAERFSRKKPPVRQRPSNEAAASFKSVDSTGSCNEEEPESSEDIIKRYSEIDDYSYSSCASLKNAKSMIMNTTTPSQS